MPRAIVEDADDLQRLRHLFDRAILREQQADAGRREHDARLDRPENAIERRGDDCRRHFGSRRHAERRRQEALTGRRLHIGEQIFVRREPIDNLVVRVGLDLRRSQPASMFDRGPRQPRDGDDPGHDAEQNFHADEDIFDRVHRPTPVVVVRRPAEGSAEEEDRVVRDLRMLRQIGGERRVRREVILPGQQRRIQPEHLADRRRVLFEDSAQPFLGFERGLLVGDGGRGREGGRGRGCGFCRPARGRFGLDRHAGDWRCGQQEEAQRDSCRHYPLYTQGGAER